jgi:glycosyltransferase involved in cell wall biosynthesis
VPAEPLVTVAVTSLNQGRYLAQALESILAQGVPVEIFVADGGSRDESVEVLRRFAPRLAGWRSYADAGQSGAINEGVAKGRAPFVCWLNSDDWMLPRGLQRLLAALDANAAAPMAYGRTWNFAEDTQRMRPAIVRPFDEWLMAQLCIVSQPGTLIRRSAWQAAGGVDESLHMAMDYDLWWRLYRRFGKPAFVDEFVAVNREHKDTKTSSQRRAHYREAMAVVRKHYGRVPLKWWLAQPYAVWYRSLIGR